MVQTRIPPFNTAKTYPEQRLDSDLAEAVTPQAGSYVTHARNPREAPS